jgi:hypothetical protein
MVYWPLNAPHRISSDNELPISFTTEFFTPGIKRHVRASTANGILRSFGWKPRSRQRDRRITPSWASVPSPGTGYVQKRQEKPVQSTTLAEALGPHDPMMLDR